MDIFKYILIVIISYLLGSISFPIIVTYLFTKKDIRKSGSGNAGGTNVIRTLGILPGLLVILLDILKCVVAVLISKMLAPSGAVEMTACLAGLCCILGHMFPIFFNFKGGKGIASGAGMVLAVNVWAFLVLVAIFVITVAITRYISLGSIFAAMSYPVTMGYIYKSNPSILFILLFALFTASLIIIMHRGNIERLLEKNERKFAFRKA